GQLAPIGESLPRRPQFLQCRLVLTRGFAHAQRKACAMDAPVIGVEIDVVMFDRCARFAAPTRGARAFRQPLPDTVELLSSQLPFQLTVIGGCVHIGTAFRSAPHLYALASARHHASTTR